MSSVPQGNRYAPPSAHVEDVAGVGQLELAGRGARLGAAIVDGLLIGVAFWAISLLTPWSLFSPRSNGLFSRVAINGVLGMGVFALIQGYLLAARGQTVGKLLLDIKIVRSNGEAASAGRLLGLRYGIGFLINMVPFLGGLYGLIDALFIFRESRQCLHDSIADTIVVKA